MANVLPKQKQVAVLKALVEGCSVRGTARMTDVSIPTILSLLVRVGEGCAALHDRVMRDLHCTHVECDEIWAYVGKKQRQVTPADDASRVGDTWTFVAIDADSKVVPAYRVGKRDMANTAAFVDDPALAPSGSGPDLDGRAEPVRGRRRAGVRRRGRFRPGG